mgnify:CR=1 FL=1
MEENIVAWTLLNRFEKDYNLISSFQPKFETVQNSDAFQKLLDECVGFFDCTLLGRVDNGVFPISYSLICGVIDTTSEIREIDKEIPFSLDIARDAVVNMLSALTQAYQKELEIFKRNNNL